MKHLPQYVVTMGGGVFTFFLFSAWFINIDVEINGGFLVLLVALRAPVIVDCVKHIKNCPSKMGPDWKTQLMLVELLANVIGGVYLLYLFFTSQSLFIAGLPLLLWAIYRQVESYCIFYTYTETN